MTAGNVPVAMRIDEIPRAPGVLRLIEVVPHHVGFEPFGHFLCIVPGDHQIDAERGNIAGRRLAAFGRKAQNREASDSEERLKSCPGEVLYLSPHTSSYRSDYA